VGSYYVARNGGEVAPTFARYMSLPAHYRADRRPPPVPDTLAWNGAAIYDPSAEYATHFDLILYRPEDDEPDDDPRPALWGPSAARIEVVSHRGRWWLLDARRWAESRTATTRAP
jgi:hypothetical protein